MKMKKSDYLTLETIVGHGVKDTKDGDIEGIIRRFKKSGLTMMRMRWDLLWHSLDNSIQGKYGDDANKKASYFMNSQYDKGLNDTHIDTALKKITGTK